MEAQQNKNKNHQLIFAYKKTANGGFFNWRR